MTTGSFGPKSALIIGLGIRQSHLSPVIRPYDQHQAGLRRTSCATTHATTSLELSWAILPKAEPCKWQLKADLLPTDQHSDETLETSFGRRKQHVILDCSPPTLDHRRRELDRRPHETSGVVLLKNFDMWNGLARDWEHRLKTFELI